eukprot:357014-Chlamydomonas_euryale.AAC.5
MGKGALASGLAGSCDHVAGPIDRQGVDGRAGRADISSAQTRRGPDSLCRSSPCNICRSHTSAGMAKKWSHFIDLIFGQAVVVVRNRALLRFS